jgi:hypothetical protein
LHFTVRPITEEFAVLKDSVLPNSKSGIESPNRYAAMMLANTAVLVL